MTIFTDPYTPTPSSYVSSANVWTANAQAPSPSYMWFNYATWIIENYSPGISSLALSELTDVTVTTPSNGQILSYNTGTGKWVNSTPSSGTLAGLSDVHFTSVANGQTLVYDSGTSKWVNGTGFLTETGVQNVSNKTLDFSNIIHVEDGDGLVIRNHGDASKQVKFNLAPLSSGVNSVVFHAPSSLGAAINLVETTAIQTLQNKDFVTCSFDGAVNSFSNIAPASLGAAVPIAKGGTNLTALGSANQVLAVNSGGTALAYTTFTPLGPVFTGLTAASTFSGGATPSNCTANAINQFTTAGSPDSYAILPTSAPVGTVVTVIAYNLGGGLIVTGQEIGSTVPAGVSPLSDNNAATLIKIGGLVWDLINGS